MYELFAGRIVRNEREVYQKWYLENTLISKPGKGIKPVLNKILDTIGL